MLDAHPHGEGFGLQPDAPAMKQFVDVPGRMSRGQHHGGPFDERRAAPHADHTAALDFQIGHPAAEHDLASGLNDRPADIADDARQAVGTDVRMGLVEDLGTGAVEYERAERLVVIAALLAACEQLSVGEGSGAALPEGVIRIGIDGPVAVDLGDVDLPGRDIAPPFEHHGPQPQLDQPQRGEQPRGSRSHDDHLGTARHRRIIEMHGGRQWFPVDIDLQGQVDLHLPAAGVDGAFDDPHERNIRLCDSQPPGGERRIDIRVGGLFGRERKGDILRHILKLSPTKINKKAR